jgi:Domain of unknown function (DUF4189)
MPKHTFFLFPWAIALASLSLFVAESPAQASDRYGAIAYSPRDGADGYGYNFSTRAAAESRALSECIRYGGSGCRVVIWFRNACAALAINPAGAFGSGWAVTSRLAESIALESCGQRGANCRIKRWVCTDR